MRSQKVTITLALACLVLLLYGASALFPLPLGSLGTTDFIQYWRSWNLMKDGINPYDPITAKAYQEMRGLASPNFVMSWNPPWSFTLLSPFILADFGQAAMLWMLLQFIFVVVIASTLPRALEMKAPGPLLRASAAIIFFPILSSIYFGQLGALNAMSVTLFLFFLQRGSLFLSGLSLVPISMKPHLLFLFIVPGIQWLLGLPRNKALQFLSGALGGLIALISVTFILAPSAFSYWIEAMRLNYFPIETAVPFPAWQTATLTTWLRIALTANDTPTWPLNVVPATALIITIIYFCRSRKPIIWKDVTPPLLCFSLLTNSYGWAFDQSVLLVTQFAIVCGALTIRALAWRVTILTLAFSLQALAIWYSNLPQHYFAWLPLALLLLFMGERVIALITKR